MSTRCNIVIEEEIPGRKRHRRVVLYRHYDGYPGVTGVDVIGAARLLAAQPWDDAAEVANHFLKEFHQPAVPGGKPEPVYRLSHEIQGDVKYVYRVAFCRRRAGQGASPVKIWIESRDSDWQWISGPWMTVDELIELVNRERAEINERIMARRAEQGRECDSDELHEMVV